jgi:hypothetical protein
MKLGYIWIPLPHASPKPDLPIDVIIAVENKKINKDANIEFFFVNLKE